MSQKRETIPVTIVIPVKNEEATLGDCLARLERFSSVVVIDSGSTDRTCQIAYSAGARVIDFRWNGRYPKKRNWYLLNFEHEQPWVLFLDADELVNDTFCDSLIRAISNPNISGFWINYTNYFLGSPLKYGVRQRKLALFKVGHALYEQVNEDRWSTLDMEVHEHPIVNGPVGEISSPIDHKDFKGLIPFIQKHAEYAMWEAQRFHSLRHDSYGKHPLTRRQQFKYNYLDKSWFPWLYFLFTYFVKRGFMDGKAGFHYAFFKLWYFCTIRLIILSRQHPQQSKTH